jgi:hypothetical protein
MTQIIGYIVPKEFTGHCLSTLCKSSLGHEFVAYCNLSLSEFLAEHAHVGARLVDHAEYETLYLSHLETFITSPVVVDSERFYWLLEVLPPCRWNTVGSVEMFHISERLTGNIVTWCAQYRSTFFEFVDSDSKTGFELSEKVKAAYFALVKEGV